MPSCVGTSRAEANQRTLLSAARCGGFECGDDVRVHERGLHLRSIERARIALQALAQVCGRPL